MNNDYIGINLNFFRQPEIQKLEIELGAESLNVFLKLYLKNAEQELLNIEDLKIYAREFYCDVSILEKLLTFKTLFIFEKNKFYIAQVKEKLNIVLDKRIKLSNAGKAGNLKRWAKTSPPDSHPIATQSQVKESKVKESKVKESKVKETIYADEAKEILEFFNQTFSKSLKSTVSWEDNFTYWKEIYSLEEIKKAIENLNNPKWFAKDEPSLELMFRTKNKNGKCDYIQNLLELAKVETQPPKLEEPDSFDLYMASLRERQNQKQI